MAWWGNSEALLDDNIHPIYCYLKRCGNLTDSLHLLQCTKAKLPRDFSLDGGDDDPLTVLMKPVDNPTDLFKALQTRDWGAALDCLHRNPTEAKTWIYRETDFPENEMRWKMLPLHTAIVLGAPAYLIIELLQAYPDATKQWDLNRSLPIHLAASRIDIDDDSERILYHMLKAFPESAGVENGKGRLPIELTYCAQLRKDKQKKINSWCIDAREPEGGGFELQLEMRDVMESFKCDDKVVDPSTWSLGTTPTTSSFSTKSGSLSYSFLNDVNSNKLRTIHETDCHSYDISSNSTSSCSSASSTPKSIGFHSINVQNEARSSTSVLGISLSTTSSQSTKSGTSFFSTLLKPGSNIKEWGTLTSKTSDSSSRSFNFLKKSKTSAASKESEVSDVNDPSKPNVAASKKQQGFKLLPNLPQDPMISTKSEETFKRSRSVEVCKPRVSCDSTSFDGDILNRRAYSFDLKSSHLLNSSPQQMSPAMSLPCSHNMLIEEKKLIGASHEDSSHLVLMPAQSTSSILLQQEYGHNQTRSFDLSSNQKMYQSPALSLPTSNMVNKPHSLNVDEEKFPKGNDWTRDDFNAESETIKVLSGSVVEIKESIASFRKPTTPKQQRGKWRDKAICLSLEQSTPEKATTLHFEKDLAANECFNTINNVSSDTSATQPSEQSLEECFSINQVRTESYDEETENLRLLAEVRNSFDDKSQVDSVSVSTESLSVCTQDAILADFLEEAICNINGEDKYDISNILKEMRDVAKIESIEDLILSNNKAVLLSFANKELALEMRRLLEEPVYEAQFHLESIYEKDDYLCISGEQELYED
eukprot:scaffold2600_cov73-Cyclotella_meneghiniana.AAC.15